jgi:transcriptional regulator with XRE-family HTH domain
MKKYYSFGELLVDYRIYSGLSQAEFASKIDVDIRTVQRWESDQTLVKSEKEEAIIDVTLFPYQLIRNLNASIPIPTYYDFRINKYALTELNEELPKAAWFKQQLENSTDRIRAFDYESDYDYIAKYMEFHKELPNNIKEVIHESAKIIPDMNLIITDDSGYYSGHSLIFPINVKTFNNLKSKKILENEITVDDLVNYRTQDLIILYGFDLTADSNDNMFYIVNHLLRFLRDLPNQNYLYCSTALRYDSYKLVDKLGLKIVWEEEKEKNKLGLESSRRFQEGDFREFLKG